MLCVCTMKEERTKPDLERSSCMMRDREGGQSEVKKSDSEAAVLMLFLSMKCLVLEVDGPLDEAQFFSRVKLGIS